MRHGFFIVALLALTGCAMSDNGERAAMDVIERTVGTTKNIEIKIVPAEKDNYDISAENGVLSITGSSPSAVCYAFDKYLREACNSMVSWSGKNLNIPELWSDYNGKGESPYKLRYFLNVCTFGYTAPYWDWARWEKEIDWMVLHGVNMPLASVASEAIARRVWLKMGLSEDEIASFFTGAAHLPWHRMGNLNGFDGPLDEQWHEDQIALQHKILDRMRALGMNPVAPAFAGFIPPAFAAKHPEIQSTQLTWGGFPLENNACVLAPDSPYFVQLGKMFIEEWEAEFGKAKYFLSDSFNEMKLPVDENDTEGKCRLLADYGETIYKSIVAGDPDAVWVTQGWTFGYQHDFWDRESMQALLSKVPDDRLIIVDLGNDYPKWVWHTEQTWKVQEGFYGKQWIYSYVPNFGGKVLPTGDLAMYASASVEALKSPYSANLVGFGSAPEGLENNEVVYELLADMGWQSEAVDLQDWLRGYCMARYGSATDNMLQAWNLLCKSVYSSLYSYPRYLWQTVEPDMRRKSRHDMNEDFAAAVKLFLSCSEECSESQLYLNDALEFSALYLGEIADRHYQKAYSCKIAGKPVEAAAELDKTVKILQSVDRLLASHPVYQLSAWIDYARNSAATPDLKDSYEANAKRLVTTWGGFQEDYAARFWAGLIKDYYIPRLEIYFSDRASTLSDWEEKWIAAPYIQTSKAFEEPLSMAKELVDNIQ